MELLGLEDVPVERVPLVEGDVEVRVVEPDVVLILVEVPVDDERVPVFVTSGSDVRVVVDRPKFELVVVPLFRDPIPRVEPVGVLLFE